MKIVLAITGASGAIYAQQLLENLRGRPGVELWVAASDNAQRVFVEEIGFPLRELWPEVKSARDFDVPYVSGSARFDAMIVAPCSMGMLARIASGVSNDAISRAADVFLKENRRLILVTRETPLSDIHLENMLRARRAGAVILPASPSFYGGQKTLAEACHTVTARVLDQIGITNELAHRWKA
jgi:4-hydroxy-3-polyprenylbenzoate decarboxylase